MIEMTPPQPKALSRVCIRCGDANIVSLNRCAACGFDLLSDLQRDYDLYRGGIPIDAPTGVGERSEATAEDTGARVRTPTRPGTGSANWRPFQSQSTQDQEPIKATMDLGAAVLEEVFAGAPQSGNSLLDIVALGSLELEHPDGGPMPDPVSWSPNPALHVETPVVVGEVSEPITKKDPPEADAPAPRVVGAVQGWDPSPSVDQAAVKTRPTNTASEPVFVSTGRQTRVPTEDIVSREVAVVREAPKPPEFPRAPITSDPISKRNHIKDGATTYVDAMHRPFQRTHTSWWRHDMALPLLVAGGAVALLLFAMV